MNSVRSNNIYFKYQKFTQSDCRDIGIVNLHKYRKKESETTSFVLQLNVLDWLIELYTIEYRCTCVQAELGRCRYYKHFLH